MNVGVNQSLTYSKHTIKKPSLKINPFKKKIKANKNHVNLVSCVNFVAERNVNLVFFLSLKMIYYLNSKLIGIYFMKTNSGLKKEPSGRAGVDQPS